ncbi:general amino acid permease [Pisolithus marmoratus]|nr:general amino acid permease [Pisolithus marmoratus]
MAADLQTPVSSASFLGPPIPPAQEKIPENNAFHYQGDLDRVKRALLVYLHVSTVVYGTIMSIGEMAAYAPISGSVIHYAARWLDPAAGFALGWSTAISTLLEITALTAFVSFWDSNSSHAAIYIAATIHWGQKLMLMIVGLFVINLFGVRSIIGGLVIDLGGGPDHDSCYYQREQYQYWIDPGPMVSTLEPGAAGRFIGLLVAIVPAAFSVSGFELIAMSVQESVQARTNIIRAMKFVVFRLVFYLCSVIIMGMLIPSNYPELSSQSPFVIAFERAGVKVLPSIINAIIISSAYSSANTCVFTASRILYGLAVQNQAPKIFATCTKGGLPWVAVIIASLFSFLAFMTVSSSASTVFKYVHSCDLLTSPLATMCGLIGWTVINTTYLRYCTDDVIPFTLTNSDETLLFVTQIMASNSTVSSPEEYYRSPLQPYTAMWAIFWSVFYMLISGISVFWNFNASSFVASYINLPIILCLFIGYKLWYKTKIVTELDFTSHIPTLEETGDEGLLLEKAPLLQKLGIV